MKTRIAVIVCFFLIALALVGARAGPEDPPCDDPVVTPADMVRVAGGIHRIGLCTEDLFELADLGRKVPHMSPSHVRWWFGDETPCHDVELEAFFIDAHEVTNAQYCVFASVTGYEAEGPWRKHVTAERLGHPVVDVTWNDAVAYATWAGKRLPTEAEWEAAARGRSNARYFHWGDIPDPACAHWRHQGESFFDGLSRVLFGRDIDTVETASLPANDIGVYEMLGNACEWTADDYGPYPGYEGPESPFREDDVPRTGKVIRGGSWDSPNPVFVRLTSRTPAAPTHHSPQLGFRCARSVQTEPTIGR